MLNKSQGSVEPHRYRKEVGLAVYLFRGCNRRGAPSPDPLGCPVSHSVPAAQRNLHLGAALNPRTTVFVPVRSINPSFSRNDFYTEALACPSGSFRFDSLGKAEVSVRAGFTVVVIRSAASFHRNPLTASAPRNCIESRPDRKK